MTIKKTTETKVLYDGVALEELTHEQLVELVKQLEQEVISAGKPTWSPGVRKITEDDFPRPSDSPFQYKEKDLTDEEKIRRILEEPRVFLDNKTTPRKHGFCTGCPECDPYAMKTRTT